MCNNKSLTRPYRFAIMNRLVHDPSIRVDYNFDRGMVDIIDDT